MKKIKSVWRLLISLVLPLFAGFLGSIANTSSLLTWYAGINKPFFSPPEWLFAPVWTILFILMGVAFFLIWDQGDEGKKKDKAKKKMKNYHQSAMIFFFVQLVANVLWSYLFFFFQSPFLAFVEIIILLLTIVLTIYYFKGLNKTAGWLMMPYLFWVSFATVLNFAIWQLN